MVSVRQPDPIPTDLGLHPSDESVDWTPTSLYSKLTSDPQVPIVVAPAGSAEAASSPLMRPQALDTCAVVPADATDAVVAVDPATSGVTVRERHGSVLAPTSVLKSSPEWSLAVANESSLVMRRRDKVAWALVDAATGRPKWASTFNATAAPVPSAAAHEVITRDRIWVADATRLIALDAATGVAVGCTPPINDAVGSRNWTTLVSDAGAALSVGDVAYGFGPNGEPRWRTVDADHTWTAITTIGDSALFVRKAVAAGQADQTGWIVALSVADGHTLWQKPASDLLRQTARTGLKTDMAPGEATFSGPPRLVTRSDSSAVIEYGEPSWMVLMSVDAASGALNWALPARLSGQLDACFDSCVAGAGTALLAAPFNVPGEREDAGGFVGGVGNVMTTSARGADVHAFAGSSTFVYTVTRQGMGRMFARLDAHGISADNSYAVLDGCPMGEVFPSATRIVLSCPSPGTHPDLVVMLGAEPPAADPTTSPRQPSAA